MSDLIGVERQRLALGEQRLVGGAVLPQVALAFETYGRLAADGGNAILITHGYTSSAHAAGRYEADDPQPGWWDGVIGPGKAIDTERYFVLCSNMLGSSFGSTGPASIDPRTGRAYGPDFPEIELADIVTAQRRLLESLGIRHLVAVAGVSYGGFQAFQWGVSFPEFADGLVVVCSAPLGRGPDTVAQTAAVLANDPNWHGGRYYESGGVFETMRALRLRTLSNYGYREALARRIPDPEERDLALAQLAADWARQFDANSLLVLGRAAARFDVTAELSRLRAKILYVLSTTDTLFPPSLGPEVMTRLRAAGVEAEHLRLESTHGHIASSSDAEKWAPALRRFIAGLPSSGG